LIVYLFRVLFFKEAPELISENVTSVIGKPRALEKNLEEPSYFENTQIDLTIPCVEKKTAE
jgi:hypothetical protein